MCVYILFFFFFQAEDGIRDGRVTGVQTCALPILLGVLPAFLAWAARGGPGAASRTRWAAFGFAPLAVGLVMTWSAVGHASDAGSQTPLSMTADVVHLLRSEEHTAELQSPVHLVCR